MTLLKGNELHADKAQGLELVLRKTHEECNFTEIIVGGGAVLREHKEHLGSLVSESLYKMNRAYGAAVGV